MLRKTLFLLLALLISFQINPIFKKQASVTFSLTDLCDWPVWGKSPGHDRIADAKCEPDPTKMEKLWEFKVDDNLCSSASVWNNKVFIGSEKRALCLELESGNIVWEYQTGSKTWSPPTIENGLSYIGVDDNRVLCLNASTGRLVWSFTTNGAVIRPPTVSNAKAFVGSNSYVFYCLDAYTGTKLWEFKTDGGITCHPVIDNGFVYFVSQDKKVYCLKENNGSKLWDYQLPDVSITSVAMKNRRIFLGCNDGNLYCLNPVTGKLAWSYKTEGAVRSCPAIDDEMVYFGSDDSNLYALKLSSDESITLAWKFKTSDKVFSSPAICGEHIYFGSDDKKVYCLKKKYGELVWSDEQSDKVWGSPSIAYGRMLIGSASNTLVCYGNNEENCDWFSYGRTVDNVRIAPDKCGLTGNAVRVKWDVKIGKSAVYSPIIVNGRLFFGSDDKNMYCFDASTGSRIWAFPVDSGSYPIYYNNRVYFTAQNDNGNGSSFYCLNPDSGTQIWEYKINGQISYYCIIGNGKVFFGNMWGDDFYCLDADNGQEIWTYKAIGGSIDTPILYNGKVFFGTCFEGQRVYCLDQETGGKIWEFQIDTRDSVWSPTVNQGKLFFESGDKIYCVEAETGVKVWETQIGGTLLGIPVVYDNRVYCGNKIDEFYCLDESSGQILWKYKINGDINLISPGNPFICNGKVYYCNDYSLLCFEMKNGNPLWEYRDNGGIVDVIIADGLIYYGTGVGDGRLVCLEGYFETQLSQPPRYECKDCRKYMQFTINTPNWNICGDEQPAMLASPVISSGRTFLVIRNIAETIGAKVSWDELSRTTTISLPSKSLQIKLQIGNNVATVNGKSTYIDINNLDIKPFISEGRTMLPLRFITENLGLEISWDALSKSATVFYKDPDCPLIDDYDFILNDTNGQTHQLSKYKGKPVLLDFMASWCGPCKQAAPIIKNIAKKYGNKLYVFSIDLQEGVDKVKELKEELGAGWPFLLDSDGSVSTRYNVTGIPHFVLFDKAGNKQFEYDGFSDNLQTILEQQIDRFIK